MKNNRKVRPFHIDWKESCAERLRYGSSGFRMYSSAKGTVIAMSGRSLSDVAV